MISRDRLIVLAAGLPGILGFGLAIAISRDLIVSMVVGGVASLVGAGISLTPPVRDARMRLVRRKYPDAS